MLHHNSFGDIKRIFCKKAIKTFNSHKKQIDLINDRSSTKLSDMFLNLNSIIILEDI